MNLFNIIANTIYLEGGTTSPSEPSSSTINLTSADFNYNLYDRSTANYEKRSAFATVQINTDASNLNVSFYSPMADANYLEDAIISVYDENWLYVGSLNPENTGVEQTKNIALSGTGFRKYYLVEGGNTQSGSTDFKGTSITSIEAVNGTVGIVTIPNSTNRIVTIGDSISIGDGSSQNSRYGWVIRLRDALRMNNWSVTSQGWGAAYTLGMFNNNTLQQAGADRALSVFSGATGRKILVWVLGTNDFGYIVGDPTAVATAAASVWDKIYASDNEVEVICVTPIYRNNQDTPNSGGWVLDDYRTALTNEANTRAFVSVYDGEPIITAGDLTDNVHPNNGGHQKIADYIEGIL